MDPKDVRQHELDQFDLLETIKRNVSQFQEEQGQKKAAVGLILATLAYLSGRGEEREEGQINAFDFIPCLRFFAEKVRKPVEQFTESEEERTALIARFFEWLTASFVIPFKLEYLVSRQ